MFSSFKNKIITIKNSFFYSICILLLIIITFIYSFVFIATIIKNITKKKKIIIYKNTLPYNTSSPTQANNTIIKITTRNNRLQHNTHSLLISDSQCEELFRLHFKYNIIKTNTQNKTQTITKKNTRPFTPKKIEKNKKVIKKEMKKILITKKIEKQIIPIIKNNNNILNNTKKIIIKDDTLATNTLKSLPKNIQKNKLLINKLPVIDIHEINYKSLSNNQNKLIENNMNLENEEQCNQSTDYENYNTKNDNDLITDAAIEYEKTICQNELTEYIMRLKKHIRQFPGKKVNLEITILLDGSVIKEIIFPKKLFSLAYKMYIINILQKIDIPRKLYNKKLLISL